MRAAAFLIAGAAAAQAPRIGTIDFYGVHKVSVERLRGVLEVKEGDPLPRSKGDVEDRLEQIPGVVRARLEAACCDEGNAILYVGIEEKGAPHFEYHPEPAEHLNLPEELVHTYHHFLAAVEKAVRRGETAEDISRGHSLMVDEDSRSCQLQFVKMAEENLEALRNVLRKAEDSEQRAIAAYVIGYHPKKKLVLDDLQYAMRDPDDTVRSNAMRALGAVAVLAAKDKEQEIRFSATWFVEMLNSLVWTDRNNAAVSLVNLTEGRDEHMLTHLRESALPSLVEMARWKHLPHALPAFILLGRLAGIQEKQIQELWARGEREAVIKRATAKRPAQ